jgi:Mg2+-importing ATPase
LERPKEWSAMELARFMVVIGPISSIFDIATFYYLWHFKNLQRPEEEDGGADSTMFQSCWFIEVLIYHNVVYGVASTHRFVMSNRAY